MFIALVQIHFSGFLCVCGVAATDLMSLLLCAHIVSIYLFVDLWICEQLTWIIQSHSSLIRIETFCWLILIDLLILFLIYLMKEENLAKNKINPIWSDICICLSFSLQFETRILSFEFRVPSFTFCWQKPQWCDPMIETWNAKVLIFHFVCKWWKCIQIFKFGPKEWMKIVQKSVSRIFGSPSDGPNDLK